MSDFRSYFKGKRVTIMGLGLLGRGIGDAAFLSECGAIVTVTDMKDEAKLADAIAQLKTYPNITYHLGGHIESDFTDTDLVIKAAGVPQDSHYIAAAHDAGVHVAMSTALFAKFAHELGATIIGVTGTRGKSTVSHLIFHALHASGKRAHLGGNIRGVSTLALMPEVHAGDIAVLELDSWQLQGFGSLGISPQIAVFTNLMPDHQNYYADMDAYFADKANIFTHQNKEDALFIGEELASRVRAAHPPADPTVVGPLAADWSLKIPGEHNRVNASFAAAALFALGIGAESIRSAFESFEGVEGRLQYMGLADGVKVYNDNNATTPEATIAALTSLSGQRNIILIAGGSDKGLALETLVAQIQKNCKGVYLLAGTGTERLRSMIDAQVFMSLETAVDSAFNAAEFGDIVLFSPAFASFGEFTNEYDRNDRFVSLARERIDA